MTTGSLRRLASQRCFHHVGREAVARCVVCGRAYCRECVAEHDGRMICATCLREAAAPKPKPARRWPARLGRAVLTAFAVFIAWCGFYGAALLLQEIPARVHEGTIWLEE
jgi:hypothetical protein